MSAVDHVALMEKFERMFRTHDWGLLHEFVADDVHWEYPQSGEVFRGVANVRAQFENYPNLEPGTTELKEVLGGTDYALGPNYTVVAVHGSGDRGTTIVRAHYPDGTWWWAINLYEVRDGKIVRSRSFFAPDFDAPGWRAPFRQAP